MCLTRAHQVLTQRPRISLDYCQNPSDLLPMCQAYQTLPFYQNVFINPFLNWPIYPGTLLALNGRRTQRVQCNSATAPFVNNSVNIPRRNCQHHISCGGNCQTRWRGSNVLHDIDWYGYQPSDNNNKHQSVSYRTLLISMDIARTPNFDQPAAQSKRKKEWCREKGQSWSRNWPDVIKQRKLHCNSTTRRPYRCSTIWQAWNESCSIPNAARLTSAQTSICKLQTRSINKHKKNTTA